MADLLVSVDENYMFRPPLERRLVPTWQPGVAYTAGQRVVTPEGDVATAKQSFTSGATYDVSKWNPSRQDGRLSAVEVEGAQLAAAGPLTGASPISDGEVAFSITDEDGRRSWLEVGANGGPTSQAAAQIVKALPPLPIETDPVVDTTAVYSITDEDGRRSWLEVDANGGPTMHAVEMLKQAGLGGASDGTKAVTEASLDPALAVRIPPAFSVSDSKFTERRSLTVRDRFGIVRPLTSDPFSVAFWGDSLFNGYPTPPFAADRSNSVPGVFASLYPAATVYNGGVSGQPADEIAIRQGGLVPMLAVAGGTIPASGAVTVTASGQIDWRLDRDPGSSTGVLAGVHGTLAFARTGAGMTFTRTTAGAAVTAAGSLPWSSDGGKYTNSLQVILAGRNDIGYNAPGAGVVDRVVTATIAMVESLTPAHPRVLLLGTTTSTAETAGTNGHTQVTSINNTLKALYPQYFFDYRAWLVKEAIYELGITPTADDRAKMAADTLPPSIMTDPVHYSPATAAKAAARIKAELTNRGWI